jgi:hypothetical protein
MYKDFLNRIDNLLKFESEDFLIFDSSVRSNKTTFTISTQFSLENEDHLIGQIRSEIKRSFYKQIFKKIKSNDNFIDLRNLKYFDKYRATSEKLIFFKFKNLVSNSRISAELQDSPSFHFSKMKTNPVNDIYEIGKYSNFEAYCDPYLRYNDEEIYLFDDIRFNINNFQYDVIGETTFTPRLKITYDFYFEIGDNEIIYVIDDEFQKSLPILISQMRDEKIDQLLGE